MRKAESHTNGSYKISQIVIKIMEYIYIWEGNGTPLQYSCLENSMDRAAWKVAVYGVAEGRTRLSDFTFTFHFHALKQEMATHSMFLPGESQGQGSLVAAIYGVTQSRTRLKQLSSSSSSSILAHLKSPRGVSLKICEYLSSSHIHGLGCVWNFLDA